MNYSLRILIALATSFLGFQSIQGATVAYWRFESGPANAQVLHATAPGVFDGTTRDVSGNGNSLSTGSLGGPAGYVYRNDVSSPWVPQDGSANTLSVKNTGPEPSMFTSAAGSSPSGINAETMTPGQFTVEASYKPEANAAHRTIVGRDARYVSTSRPDLAAFYLQVRPDDSVSVNFTDVSGFTHEAFSPPGWLYGFNFGSNPNGTGTPWYHLAAVSDGSMLKLYVDNVLIASNNLALSGSPNTALAKGAISGTSWKTGAWSVGRGLYEGNLTDRAYGYIDEVRISNAALTPGELLYAPRPEITSISLANKTMSIQARSGQPGATCNVLQSYNLKLPIANWTPIGARNFDANGSFTFSTPFIPSGPPRFFQLKANNVSPSAGAMTYSLNGDWPADARARIIYAMNGAVAQYNRHGYFKKHITVNWSPGTPTADGSYSGWINFGSNPAYQNFRTALHEISHTLGVGTIWQWRANLSVPSGTGSWTGTHGVAQIREFEGPGANIWSDGTHFWNYGLNYDSEGNTESFRRHVLMVAAFRKDMGVEND